MELSVILEYSGLDRSLLKLENEFYSTAAVKAYNASKRSLDAAKEQVGKLNRDAGDYVKQMQAMIAEYDAVEKELKEAESASEEIEDVNGADFFIRNVQKLINQLKTLSAEIGKMSARIVELNQAYNASMTAGTEAAKTLKALKAGYDAEQEKIKPRVQEVKVKLLEVKKKCSPEFLEVYERLRKQKKFPVVVPLMEDGRSCGGCFMELAGDAISKLNAKDYIECPDCGRILYRK